MTNKQCAICGKTSTLVWTRSRLRAGKYNPTVKKRQQPNLQWVKIPVFKRKIKDGKSQVSTLLTRIKACTKCIKKIHMKKFQQVTGVLATK